MRTAAVLPVKRLALSKRRLRAAVAQPLRGELAYAMVSDVLEALRRCRSIEHTFAVTADERAASAARAQGATVLADTAEEGQSAAAVSGIKRVIDAGFERVLCVPGDCPALDPAQLESLLAAEAAGAAERREVVIVPDRHGTGTNALLLAPPDAIVPAFGPDSFERHRSLARAASLACRVERPPSLLLDIDTGEDLAQLKRTAARDGSASRTRALLANALDGSPPRVS
jgi:2-phospho-L-lactate/phosphoenolpyruvate guanylyltransferase